MSIYGIKKVISSSFVVANEKEQELSFIKDLKFAYLHIIKYFENKTSKILTIQG